MNNLNHLVVRSVTVLIHAALTFLVLSVLLVLTLPMILNPNNYMAQMADKVLEKTGRTLTFAKAIEWEMFPDPLLTMKQLSLNNAPGFADGPMVKIQRLEGKLSLRHLLRLQFVMEQLTASGVEVFLESNAAGQNNWDDLVTRLTAQTEKSANLADLPDGEEADRSLRTTTSLAQLGALALTSLSTRAITLREGAIHACQPDGSGGRSCLHLTHLAFTPQLTGLDRRPVVQIRGDIQTPDPSFVGRVTIAYRQPARAEQAVTQWLDTEITVRGRVDVPPAKELDLVWHSDVTLGPEPNRVHIARPNSRLTVWSDVALFREFTLTMKGDAEADLATGKVHLPQGGLAWRIKSDQLPPAGVELLVKSPIEMDWRQETLHMVQLQAVGPAQMRMEGLLRGKHLLSRPTVDAELTFSRFDPRALLVSLGRSVPPTNDPSAFQSASGAAVIHLDDQALTVNDLVLAVDDARLVGSVRWSADGRPEREKAAVLFDLQADRLEPGRYLPPAVSDPGVGGAVERALLAPELWLANLSAHGLRDLDVQGTLRLGELLVGAVRATDVSLDLDLHDQQLQLQPYRMNMDGGQLETRIQWDDRGDDLRLTVDKTATDIQLEPILRTLPNGRWLTGRADLTAHLVTQGRQPDMLWKNMNGVLTLAVRDGTIQGMDLAERLREAQSKAQAQAQEQRSFTQSVEKAGAEKRGVTPFAQLTATGYVVGGMLDNKDLRLLSPPLSVTGKGGVDLARGSVDYSLEVEGGAAVQAGGQGTGARLVLPLRIQGDLSNLKAPVIAPLRPRKPQDQGYL
ncbi:MAG: AsmA family protein [Magnetococcus sp. YQC-3]